MEVESVTKEIDDALADMEREKKNVPTKKAGRPSMPVSIPNPPVVGPPPVFFHESEKEAKDVALIAARLEKVKAESLKRLAQREKFQDARSSQRSNAFERRTHELSQGVALKDLSPACVFNSHSVGTGTPRDTFVLQEDEVALEALRAAHAKKSAKEVVHYQNQGLNAIGSFEAFNCQRCDRDCSLGACQQHSQFLSNVETFELPANLWVDPKATKMNEAPNLLDYHTVRSGCSYPRCVTSWSHSISCCPQLNSRCPRCLVRGHYEAVTEIDAVDTVYLCDSVDLLFQDFLAYYQQGVLTRFSEKYAELGFWPCRYADTRTFLRKKGFLSLMNRNLTEVIQFIDDLEEMLVDMRWTYRTMLADYPFPPKSLKEMRKLAVEAVKRGHFHGDGSGYAIELTTTQRNNVYHDLQPSKKDMVDYAATHRLEEGVSEEELEVSEEHNQNPRFLESARTAPAVPEDVVMETGREEASLSIPEARAAPQLPSAKTNQKVSVGSYSTAAKFGNPGAKFPSLAETHASLKKKAEEGIEGALREQKELNLRKDKHRLDLEAVKRNIRLQTNPAGYGQTPGNAKRAKTGPPPTSNQNRYGGGGGNPYWKSHSNQNRGGHASGSGPQSRNGPGLGGRGGGGGQGNNGRDQNEDQHWTTFEQWKKDHPELINFNPQFQTLQKASPQVASSSASANDGFKKVQSRSKKRSESRRRDDSPHSSHSSRKSRKSKD